MESPECKDTEDGAALSIRVMPRGRKDELTGVRNGRLCVRTTAPPVDGAANERVVRTLAKILGARRSGISIVSGERARDKILLIAGASAAEVCRRLAEALGD